MRVRRRFAIASVLIIAFAAAIPIYVVPCSSDKLTRSQVSRITNDMRSVKTAIESFHNEERRYPGMEPLASFAKHPRLLGTIGGAPLHSTAPGTSEIAGLTTPISYLSSLYPDVFVRFEEPASREQLPFAYYTDGKGWILFSAGLDGSYQIRPERDYDSSTSAPVLSLLNATYDSTNGLVSRGDIWLARPWPPIRSLAQ